MESTSIYAALAAVQSELKAPKGQMNTFGGYRYRSCEDILEAVKPILKAHDLLLTLSDEPKVLEGWHYIEATAKVESLDVPNDTPDDSRVCILLKSIDSRLYQQNEDMKKAIDQLVGLNSALVELQNEIKVCASCMTAMLDALNDIKSQNSPQAEPEAPANKYPGKNFANWGEVIRRVEVYGDKFIADNLRGTKASLDGVTLYLACTPSTKKFLKSSAVAIPRIKQQCRNVVGYGVEVKIIDL